MNDEEGRLRKSPLSTDTEGRSSSDDQLASDQALPGGMSDGAGDPVARARQHYRPLDIAHLLRRTG